jgi:hypothetical protein
MTLKKVISKNLTKIGTFPLLLMFVKLVLPITFFGAFFQNFFNGFEISMKFGFFIPFLIKKENCLGHISTFFKL